MMYEMSMSGVQKMSSSQISVWIFHAKIIHQLVMSGSSENVIKPKNIFDFDKDYLYSSSIFLLVM